MNVTEAISEARERILKTASELFYANGYRATGINEIIKKSGVAKATFYAHFPSKEALALAYVQQMSHADLQETRDELRKLKGPYTKLIALLESFEPWAEARDYRGCAYLNMCSELPDPNNPVRKEGKLHYEVLKAIVKDLVTDLKEERGSAWKGKEVAQVTDEYMLIMIGALAMAEVYHHPEPIHQAVRAAKRLLA